MNKNHSYGTFYPTHDLTLRFYIPEEMSTKLFFNENI